MKTSKVISTISYNTGKFLHATLERLYNNNNLDFWAYIYHFAEEDEEKDHFHVYMAPSALIDTRQLEREFIEFVEGEKLPRRVRPFEKSKFQDWFLYDMHHSGYLASKGQSRKYHYTYEDFVTSDNVYFLEQIHHIDWTKINPLGAVIDAAKSGMDFSEFLETCNLSLLQIRSAQFVFEQVKGGVLDRAGRLTHSPKK